MAPLNLGQMASRRSLNMRAKSVVNSEAFDSSNVRSSLFLRRVKTALAKLDELASSEPVRISTPMTPRRRHQERLQAFRDDFGNGNDFFTRDRSFFTSTAPEESGRGARGVESSSRRWPPRELTRPQAAKIDPPSKRVADARRIQARHTRKVVKPEAKIEMKQEDLEEPGNTTIPSFPHRIRPSVVPRPVFEVEREFEETIRTSLDRIALLEVFQSYNDKPLASSEPASPRPMTSGIGSFRPATSPYPNPSQPETIPRNISRFSMKSTIKRSRGLSNHHRSQKESATTLMKDVPKTFQEIEALSQEREGLEFFKKYAKASKNPLASKNSALQGAATKFGKKKSTPSYVKRVFAINGCLVLVKENDGFTDITNWFGDQVTLAKLSPQLQEHPDLFRKELGLSEFQDDEITLRFSDRNNQNRLIVEANFLKNKVPGLSFKETILLPANVHIDRIQAIRLPNRNLLFCETLEDPTPKITLENRRNIQTLSFAPVKSSTYPN